MSETKTEPPKMDGEAWRLIEDGEAHAIEILDSGPRVCVWVERHSRWASEEAIYALPVLAAYAASLRAMLTAPLPEELAAIEARTKAARREPEDRECAGCHGTYAIDADAEPSAYCHPCAQTALDQLAADVPRLLTGIRAQAATIEARDREIAALRERCAGLLREKRDALCREVTELAKADGSPDLARLAAEIERLRATGGEP